MDVPVAVTAFTPERVDKLNVEDLGDLGGQVPNLTIYAARGSSSTITAYIRGVGQSDPLWGVDPGVGIYLDDVYIARPQGALLDVFDVERIEVLRGPQGTLYGKNTIGGAIKYVSRQLSPKFDGYGQITVGNYSQLDAKAAVGGALDEGGMFRARVAVASLNRDGFGENIVTDQEVSDKEINAARVSFGIFASETFDIIFNYDWMDDQSGVRGAKMLLANRLRADRVRRSIRATTCATACPTSTTPAWTAPRRPRLGDERCLDPEVHPRPSLLGYRDQYRFRHRHRPRSPTSRRSTATARPPTNCR